MDEAHQEKEIRVLLGLVEELIDNVDEDGWCENGCSCGECDNCLNHAEIVGIYNEINARY